MPNEMYYSHPRREMLAFLPTRRARVLEIGCAEGHFLANVPGVEESWGIEPTDAAQVAAMRLGRVLRGTFDTCRGKLPEDYFDAVVINDVMEHMIDHDGFLSAIPTYLAPGGVLVGSIPNVRFYRNTFEFLFEKDWCYRESGILDRTHLRFFTEKSFKRALAKHGFRLEAFGGLSENIHESTDARSTAYRMLAKTLVLGTLGYFADIQYLQFGFRAARPA